jgi:hypothetical protein
MEFDKTPPRRTPCAARIPLAGASGSMRPCAVVLSLLLTGLSAAAELPTLAGPAMGTTYRVTLAADIPGMTRGEVHREVEAMLAQIDRAASTWRNDSDASRFNRTDAGEWVTVSADLLALVETAREIHDRSEGAFDITVGPAESGRPIGMRHVVSRLSPPALRKSVPRDRDRSGRYRPRICGGPYRRAARLLGVEGPPCGTWRRGAGMGAAVEEPPVAGAADGRSCRSGAVTGDRSGRR